MTENTLVPQPTQPVVPIVEGKGLVPQDFDGLWKVSQVMAISGFVPKEMEGRPEAVFIACQMGMEVGLSLMASVQNIAVIDGRPAMWGDAVLALVRSKGKMAKFREYFSGTFPNDDFTAVCVALRGDEEIKHTFSVADAKKAGLWDPEKTVSPWHKYPKRMLQMRARSWALRDGFGDILKGIQTTEEIMDLEPAGDGSYSVVPEPTVEPEKSEKPETSEFDRLASEKIDYPPDSTLDRFLKETAEANNATVDALKKRAAGNFSEFWKAFESWKSKTFPESKLSDEIKAQIDEAFNISPALARKALIDVGTDRIEAIPDEKEAEKFLKKFNELVSLSDDK